MERCDYWVCFLLFGLFFFVFSFFSFPSFASFSLLVSFFHVLLSLLVSSFRALLPKDSFTSSLTWRVSHFHKRKIYVFRSKKRKYSPLVPFSETWVFVLFFWHLVVVGSVFVYLHMIQITHSLVKWCLSSSFPLSHQELREFWEEYYLFCIYMWDQRSVGERKEGKRKRRKEGRIIRYFFFEIFFLCINNEFYCYYLQGTAVRRLIVGVVA